MFSLATQSSDRIRKKIAAIKSLREAATQMRKCGEVEGALRTYRQVAEAYEGLCEEVVGKRREAIRDCLAGAYNGIACCLRERGELLEAVEYFRRCEEIRKQIDTRSTYLRKQDVGWRRALNLHDLGAALLACGEDHRQEAVSVFREAVRLYGRECKAGRLPVEHTQNYGRATSVIVGLLEESRPDEAAKILSRFVEMLKRSGAELGNEKLLFELSSHQKKQNLRRHGLSYLDIEVSHEFLAFSKGLLWCPLVLFALMSVKTWSYDPTGALFLCVMYTVPLYVLNWLIGNVSSNRRSLAWALASTSFMLLAIAWWDGLGFPVWIPMIVGTYAISGVCCQLFFRAKGVAMRWRERYLLHAEHIRTDRALARRIEDFLPRPVRWLAFTRNGPAVELRPSLRHVFAECLVVAELVEWIDTVLFEYVARVAGSQRPPPADRSYRDEKNLSQPWAGRRIWCALLPRGAHVTAA